MKPYDHKDIEKKWQDEWEKTAVYKTEDTSDKPKCYVLDMFPYPSGEGLHVGHPKGYIATDVYSRFKQMSGYNVLHPMGWDAFGLPAENYAIKNKVHPRVAVEKNIKRYKEQLSVIGFNYDWSREVDTTDPNYYKWTQWIFLKLFEKGLAYESHEPINWCPSCQTGLANEDLEGGKCERCGSVVEKKPIRQWVLKITDYADRLLEDLPALNWPESIKESQRNWIGKSEGAEIVFQLTDIAGQADNKHSVTVFTTRPDTIFGATFLAVSAELAKKWLDVGWLASDDIKKYITDTIAENNTRDFGEKEKTGIFAGIYAINPANQEKIPVWIVNYVLGDVGTGAIMAVPAHDERDFEFATKFNLPVKEVIEPLVTREVGEDTFKKDEPISERRAVVAVIKHWSEDKYLGVEWVKTAWKGFVIGGIENGEDAAVAGVREITEETGYKNAEFVKNLGGNIHARFWQKVKNQNRLAHFQPALFQLKDGEMMETSEEEKALHKFQWLTLAELEKFITHADMKIVWDRIDGKYCYTGDDGIVLGCSNRGILANSGQFDGQDSEEVKKKITDFVGGKWVNKYKLRDWVFSRQRYWGEPIPLIHCAKCGVVAVPEKELPVRLPEVEHYEPTGTGESPLANITDWVNTTCPKCGGAGKRETNTMPQWAGSSWYYLRYIDPKNNEALVDKAKEKYWSPVDFYVGGAEHATRHLIYARFWHKFLYDIGAVSYKEPFTRLQHVGLILAEDGRKMSKRWGNVINPDEIIKLYGADTLRVYEMFMGPFDQNVAWSTESIIGPRRFVERVWRLREKVNSAIALPSLRGLRHESHNSLSCSIQLSLKLNQTIKKVGEDIESFGFNTAISSLMILVNEMEKQESLSKEDYEVLLKLVAPFAPHFTEELWRELGNQESIHLSAWPKVDESKLVSSTVKITVQVNSKVRATIDLPRQSNEEAVLAAVKTLDAVQKWLGDSQIKRVVFVPDKLINILI